MLTYILGCLPFMSFCIYILIMRAVAGGRTVVEIVHTAVNELFYPICMR